jgi:hypothetical protein
MAKIAEDHSTPYFRFNVQAGLENMMLDEWTEKKRDGVRNKETGAEEKIRLTTIKYLEVATETYLASIEKASSRDPEVLVQDNINRSAQLLVEYRRAREMMRMGEGWQNGVVR